MRQRATLFGGSGLCNAKGFEQFFFSFGKLTAVLNFLK